MLVEAYCEDYQTQTTRNNGFNGSDMFMSLRRRIKWNILRRRHFQKAKATNVKCCNLTVWQILLQGHERKISLEPTCYWRYEIDLFKISKRKIMDQSKTKPLQQCSSNLWIEEEYYKVNKHVGTGSTLVILEATNNQFLLFIWWITSRLGL